MTSATVFQIQSGTILLLLYLGVYFRRARTTHMRIMSLVIVWDIFLILQIELTRSAIDKAVKVVQNPMMLNIHVALAVTTVVLYLLQIKSGRGVSKGVEQKRSFHKKCGIATVVLRTATFITSFFAVS